jgi:hypothetical protein
MQGLQKKPATASATKHYSQNIVNQRSSHHMPPSSSHAAAAAAAHHSSNHRDNSITSGHSMQQPNSSFNNQVAGLSMTSYQKVRTTQPSSVKHANESYSRGEPNFSKASIEAGSGGLRAADQ